MEQKDSKIFNKTTMQAVSAFCDANNIEDKDDFIYLCFKQGFDIRKFGLLGETLNEGEKHLKTGIVGEKQVEIEVIREIRVEVPVEKIVERIVTVTDDTKINELLLKIQQLENVTENVTEDVTEIECICDKNIENELGEKIAKLEEEMSKKDNELDELRRNLDIILDKPPIEIEKIVEVDKSTDKLKMMSTTLQNLRNDLSLKNDKITELEKINQELQKTANLQNAVYMKGSNLNSRI
jgi:hypothetical protein